MVCELSLSEGEAFKLTELDLLSTQPFWALAYPKHGISNEYWMNIQCTLKGTTYLEGKHLHTSATFGQCPRLRANEALPRPTPRHGCRRWRERAGSRQ
ncbi:hypothetical protein EMIT047CA2_40082 [Pseudomonas soli]